MNNKDWSEYFLQKELLFSSPYLISPSQQIAIIQYTLKYGKIIPSEQNIVPPFWIASGLTEIPEEKCRLIPPENLGWYYYYSRLDSSLGWKWLDTEITSVVQDVLAPLHHVYTNLTRVSVLIQRLNTQVPAHRDLVLGNEYKDMLSPYLTFSGKQTLTYEGESWLKNFATPKNISHSSQKFLNLKIPISLSATSPGKPFIIYEGKKFYYNSRNRLFFLNEVEIEHGADPVDFYRGVVFVDGIFAQQHFTDQTRFPVEITEEL